MKKTVLNILSDFKKLLAGRNFGYYLLIIGLGIAAWYKTLNFWFLKAYEANWLAGTSPYTLPDLIRGHAIVYYLDWKIFGWNPWGWYLTSLFLHITASLLLYTLISKLTKNNLLAFLTGLFFVASTAYNDVLTWGSFNSYYPLLLTLILLTFLAFAKFKESSKNIYLILTYILLFIAFLIRETALAVVPLLTIFDLYFVSRTNGKKSLKQFLIRQAGFYLLIILFLKTRTSYGGVSGDTADSNVKMQIKFVKEGLYLEYARRSLLTFGKLIPSHFIPYPILNKMRQAYALNHPKNVDQINFYYFPIIGWIFFSIVSVVVLLLRKVRIYGKLLLFFFLWFTMFTAFVALALPYIDEVLIRDFEFNTMRYHYFAFVGTSVIFAVLTTLCYENLLAAIRKPARRFILITFVILFVNFNLNHIWEIENTVYTTTYEPEKRFNIQFREHFPTLPKHAAFYYYPNAVNLNNLLLEWYFTKETAYPNLAGEPFRIESRLAAMLNKIRNKEIKLSEVYFLDYDLQTGLIDRTKDVTKIILKQKDYPLTIDPTNRDNLYHSKPFNGPTVEFPYNLKLRLRVSPNYNVFSHQQSNPQLYWALVDYIIGRKKYLDTAVVTTSKTMSQSEGVPFLHLVPSHVHDDNIGNRSYWIADAIPAWISADLGSEKEVYAVSWGSQAGSIRIPSTYSFMTSSDGKTWRQEKVIRGNSRYNAVDKFDKPIKTRYIKMSINTTVSGDFALIDEFEVIDSSGKDILSFYDDRDKLLSDSRNVFSFATSSEDIEAARQRGLDFFWGKLSWGTGQNKDESNMDGDQSTYFTYNLTNFDQTVLVTIPEAEIYAGVGQFLNKRITSSLLDFQASPYKIDVISETLIPRQHLQ